MSKVAVSVRVHSFMWTYVFHPPEDVQGVELLGHVASLYLTCGDTASLFPWQLHRLRSRQHWARSQLPCPHSRSLFVFLVPAVLVV